MDVAPAGSPLKKCPCMDKTTEPGGTVTTLCRRCGAEVEIGVVKLSRLHHPPLCEKCEVEDAAG